MDLIDWTGCLEEPPERTVKSPEQSVSGEQQTDHQSPEASPRVPADGALPRDSRIGSSPDLLPTPLRENSISVEIPTSTLLSPRSSYELFEPGVPIVSEAQALATLSSTYKRLRTCRRLYRV